MNNLTDLEREMLEALKDARRGLELVLRGLQHGHVKSKAIVPPKGPIISLEATLTPSAEAAARAIAAAERKAANG